MIELVRERLDPHVRERWRLALAQTPLVARPASSVDLVTLALALALSLATYLVAFGLGADEAVRVQLLQGAAAGVTLVLLRSVLVAMRSDAWPAGRFVYAWGYAEIERDVMRVVPIDELTIVCDPVRLAEGRPRVVLSARGLRRTIRLSIREGRAFAQRHGADVADRSVLGYREDPPRIEGPLARWRPAPIVRELMRLAIGALVGGAIGQVAWLASRPRGPDDSRPPYANADGLSPRFANLLTGRRDVSHVDLDLAGCTSGALVVGTIERYLTHALETPGLGPGRLEADEEGHAHTIVRARCSWHVDPREGTFSYAEAEWTLEHRHQTLVRRHVRVGVETLIDAMTRCDVLAVEAFSPRAIAQTSSMLLQSAIARDVFVDPDHSPAMRGAVRASAGCLGELASTLDVRMLR